MPFFFWSGSNYYILKSLTFICIVSHTIKKISKTWEEAEKWDPWARKERNAPKEDSETIQMLTTTTKNFKSSW